MGGSVELWREMTVAWMCFRSTEKHHLVSPVKTVAEEALLMKPTQATGMVQLAATSDAICSLVIGCNRVSIAPHHRGGGQRTRSKIDIKSTLLILNSVPNLTCPPSEMPVTPSLEKPSFVSLQEGEGCPGWARMSLW